MVILNALVLNYIMDFSDSSSLKCRPKYHKIENNKHDSSELTYTPDNQSLILALGTSFLIHLAFCRIIHELEIFERLKRIFDIEDPTITSDDKNYIRECFNVITNPVNNNFIRVAMSSLGFCMRGNLLSLSKFILLEINKDKSNLNSDFNSINHAEVILVNFCKTFGICFKILKYQKNPDKIDPVFQGKDSFPPDLPKAPIFIIKITEDIITGAISYSSVIIDEILLAFEEHTYRRFLSKAIYFNHLDLFLENFTKLTLAKTSGEVQQKIQNCQHLYLEEKHEDSLKKITNNLKTLNLPCRLCINSAQHQCHHGEREKKYCRDCKVKLRSILSKNKCVVCNESSKNSGAIATFESCYHSIHMKCLGKSERCPCEYLD